MLARLRTDLTPKKTKTAMIQAALGEPLLNSVANTEQPNSAHINNDVEIALPSEGSRTPFTGASAYAWFTILSNSVFHTASTPVALIQLGVVTELSFMTGVELGAAWATAALLNGWANYHIYGRRATKEYYLHYVTDLNFVLPEPGHLYFYDVPEDQDKNGLHYFCRAPHGKGEKIDFRRVEDLYDEDLKGFIRNNQWSSLKKQHSQQIKSTVAENHFPIELPDADYVPGERDDYWFFLLCCLSQLPSLSSGAIVGDLAGGGLISAIVFFAFLNYLKSLLCSMPIIANSYGENEKKGNMGPIALQPGVWLVINTPVLLLLRNVAPFILGATTWNALASSTLIPSPLGTILGALLLEPVESTFLRFTMLALQKLKLEKGLTNDCYWKSLRSRDAIVNSISLDHSFANPENAPIVRIFGEIFGGRALTVSWPLQGYPVFGRQLGSKWSPQGVAMQMTLLKAIGDFALIGGSIPEVTSTLLNFFLNDVSKNTEFGCNITLTFLAIGASYSGAVAQRPNFVLGNEYRQEELGLSGNRASIASTHTDDNPVDENDECNKLTVYISTNDSSTSVDAHVRLDNGGFRLLTFGDLRIDMPNARFLLYSVPREEDRVEILSSNTSSIL